MDLKFIREKIASGKWKFTIHALEQCDEREIDISSVIVALTKGEIIEDYPEDSRGHSCLVLGHCERRPLHIVCGSHEDELVIVTVYIPEFAKWIDNKKRKRSDD